MTHPVPPPSEESKPNPLLKLLRMPPDAEVQTSRGTIYLYALRMRDLAAFGNLEPGDSVSRVRAFLPCIGSPTKVSEDSPERVPLGAEIANGISEVEIERIAEAYVQSALKATSQGSMNLKPITREPGEPAAAFLLRLVEAEFENAAMATKQIHNKLLGSSRGLFDQVRKSSAELDSTVKQFETLARPSFSPPVFSAHDELNNQIAEHGAAIAQERAEELEMVRLTGKMTAESAKTLRDLAEAATTLMEKLDARDLIADKATRKQVNIAVWSVGISAALAFCALIFSGFAYFQDRENNASGDQWQMKLLNAFDADNRQYSALERENQALLEQVKTLETRIADLENAQRTAADIDASKDTSADLRDTKPGSTLPPP